MSGLFVTLPCLALGLATALTALWRMLQPFGGTVVLTQNQAVPSALQEFWRTVSNMFGGGELLFGTFDTWQSAVRVILDLAVTAFVIYFILKLFNDSRAWQLLKGVLFILAFTFVCGVLGLNTINYVLSNSISVLVVSFVIIFQPELRTALEAVGRNSLNFLASVGQELEGSTQRSQANSIEAIALACENMARTLTGALIVIERKTGLGELLKHSPTAVILNANLTSTALEQIFYKNSPLHDGAVILKNGRIHAARCHVPLSDTYHLRKDMGTRHRAALGASEIGDTLAIVVSEERGSISIAREGRIYELESADALRSVLHRIFEAKGVFGENKSARTAVIRTRATYEGLLAKRHQEEEAALVDTRASRRQKWQRRGLKCLSVGLALVLYLYVQALTNPIETASFQSIPISKEGLQLLDQQGIKMVSADQTVDLQIRSRRTTLAKLRANPSWIVASIRVPQENLQIGRFSWRVEVKIDQISHSAYQILSQQPLEIPVALTRDRAEGNQALPGVSQSGTGGIVNPSQQP